MIAQLNSYPDQTSALDRTLPQPYSPTNRHQIAIVDTTADRFCTEIVANALKIASKGKKVLIVQLLKGGIRQGHDRIVNLAQNLDWIRCNSSRNISTSDLNDLELHSFEQLWKHVRNAARSPLEKDLASEYSLIILDDLSMAIELGLISIEATLDFLTKLPADLEIVLTGTNPHPDLLKLTA
jgi:cob(I)alamin adenosyltransferase